MTDNKTQEALMHFNSSLKSIRYCDFISLKYNKSRKGAKGKLYRLLKAYYLLAF